MHVALVGSGDVQRQRAEQRVARRLEHGRPAAHVQAVPAIQRRYVRGEDPRILGCLLEPCAHRVAAARGNAPEALLLGHDDGPHKFGGTPGEIADHRAVIKINGHVHLRHAGSRRPQGELPRIQLTIIDFLPAKQAGRPAHKTSHPSRSKYGQDAVNTVDYVGCQVSGSGERVG